MILRLPAGDLPRRKPVTPPSGITKFSHGAAGLAVVLILTAGCLRAPFTCVDPLADVIHADLDISSRVMGTITTIPLLMFAAFSIVMGDLGRRYRAGMVMVLGISMVLTGVLCRSLLGTWGLFLGTGVMGMGIAAGNVLVPAFIKARYPEKIGRLTGVYTTMLSVFSAIAGATSVPLGDAHAPGDRRAVLRDRTTWYIALYLGLQSLIYYSMVAWLSVIMQSKGLSPSEAGMVNSAYMVLGIVGSLVLPILTDRRSDLRLLGV